MITTPSCTFGLDAVALANFSMPHSGMKLCDFGTGCGIIPLLWCRHERKITVDAVEIQREAADLAHQSVSLCGLAGTIQVIGDNYLTSVLLTGGSYDRIVCNPPYRKCGAGKQSPQASRRVARYEIAATMDSIVARAAFLLKDGGTFCFCHIPERLPELLATMCRYSLEPKRLRLVQHTAANAPSLVLLEGRKNARPGLAVLPVLLVQSFSGEMTDEMKKLYGY